MSAAAYPERFDFGRVVVRTFDVIRHNLILLTALTLILYGLPKLGASLLHMATGSMPSFPGAIFSMTSGIYALAAFLGFFALQPAVFRVVAAELNGRETSIMSCLRTGLSFLLPLLGLAIVTCVGVIGGLILLVVPGIFLAVIWSVGAPSAVFERLDIGSALRRSASLTAGYRWQVFGIWAIFIVATAIVGSLDNIPRQIFHGPDFIDSIGNGASELIETIVEIIFALIGAVMVASVYFELRTLKEAAGPEDLAELLD
jgi:hypothetical protein